MQLAAIHSSPSLLIIIISQLHLFACCTREIRSTVSLCVTLGLKIDTTSQWLRDNDHQNSQPHHQYPLITSPINTVSSIQSLRKLELELFELLRCFARRFLLLLLFSFLLHQQNNNNYHTVTLPITSQQFTGRLIALTYIHNMHYIKY